MEILFCETLYPKTHARSNSFYISCLEELKCCLHVMSPPYFYDIKKESIIQNYIKELSIDGGKIQYRLNTIRYSYAIINYVKRNNINTVILASADYITLYFLTKHLPNQIELFLVHHAELDSLKSNIIKMQFFNRYKCKIEHIVFEEYIRRYMVTQLEVSEDLVHVMPHSLNQNQSVQTLNSKLIPYDLVGISGSNDEEIIKQFIQLENETSILKENNIRVLLKSKDITYDKEYLKVIKGFINDYEYNYYVSTAKYILIPFPTDFGYRESGTLMDAMSNRIKVIASDIKLMHSYVLKYPNVCHIYKNFESILEILFYSKENIEDVNEEFDWFYELHNKQNYKKTMQTILRI